MSERELVMDSFAGGGGASEGIRAALGHDPDIAINHDPVALAMHRVNHPGTRHMVQDVATVDSIGMCGGRPIGMLWMSPDCKDHSKAKGGRPREKNIRGLAWAIFGWVKALPKWQRPRKIFLENVEEFEDWSPLTEDGRRCPVQKGATFRLFVQAWRDIDYARVEWRVRRAWMTGAGTIRKRLFMVISLEDEPIVWPEPSHGNPNDPADAARIAAGELKVWKTAADIIDFSLPCPSIFETSDEIRAKFGIRANRPLAENTMARIAKGVKRYVLDNPKPFIVHVNHGRDQVRGSALDEPIDTMTATRGEALVVPVITYAQQGGGSRPADEPLHTITASGKDQNAVLMPFVTKFNRGATGHDIGEPLHTITAHASEHRGGGAAPLAIVAPVVASLAHGESGGRRVYPVYDPLTVVQPGGGKHSVIAAFLAQHNAGPRPGAPAHPADEPVSTITVAGTQQQLAAVSMLNLRGSDRRDASAEEPLRTASAAGNHAATVYAFLAKYFGEGLPSQPCDEPLHTVTAKPRHGLITVTIAGEPYAIVDIGMRMLTPRERFNAQGFRPDYIIDHGILEDGSRIELTLEQQGRMCGNSVCPSEAEALIRANYKPTAAVRSAQKTRRVADAPLFAAMETAA